MTRRGPAARRAALACALLSAALAGCPLPQPLPEVGRVDGGTVAPPRILVDGSLAPPDTVVRVSTSCPAPGPRFSLRAALDDPNTTEIVEARWFVDYDPRSQTWSTPLFIDLASAPALPDTRRTLQPFVFRAPPYDGVNGLHVVELVVSNGFLPLNDEAAALPNRSAQEGFETQVYRWVFLYDPAGGRCAE